MSRRLTIEIDDNGGFTAEVSSAAGVLAQATGDAGRVTATGALHEFAAVFRVMGFQIWQGPPTEVVTNGDEWEPMACGFGIPGVGWGFYTPSGPVTGFECEQAAACAAATLRRMFHSLAKPPSEAYEAFLTESEGWGFFDGAGHLHATFAGCKAANEFSARMKGVRS